VPFGELPSDESLNNELRMAMQRPEWIIGNDGSAAAVVDTDASEFVSGTVVTVS